MTSVLNFSIYPDNGISFPRKSLKYGLYWEEGELLEVEIPMISHFSWILVVDLSKLELRGQNENSTSRSDTFG